jgi:hypothetical protein
MIDCIVDAEMLGLQRFLAQHRSSSDIVDKAVIAHVACGSGA